MDSHIAIRSYAVGHAKRNATLYFAFKYRGCHSTHEPHISNTGHPVRILRGELYSLFIVNRKYKPVDLPLEVYMLFLQKKQVFAVR